MRDDKSDETTRMLEVVASDALAKGSKYAQVRITELKRYAKEGHWSWRMAGAAAGAAMLLLGALSFLAYVLSLSLLHALSSLFSAGFGAIALILETKASWIPRHFQDALYTNARFLFELYGRGAFYFYCGTIVALNGGLSLGVGLFVMVVGGAIFIAGRNATRKLDEVRKSMMDETTVRGKFSQHDRNGDGSLDSEEFAALCAELGSPLTPAEVEAALLMLDTDRSGAVSIEEFLRWWSGRC